MTGFRVSLDSGEVTIARARARARQLAHRLAVALIDRELYGELQQFLDGLGSRACDVVDALTVQVEPKMRQRLHLLLGLGEPSDDESRSR